jgi:hypothetical protein
MIAGVVFWESPAGALWEPQLVTSTSGDYAKQAGPGVAASMIVWLTHNYAQNVSAHPGAVANRQHHNTINTMLSARPDMHRL